MPIVRREHGGVREDREDAARCTLHRIAGAGEGVVVTQLRDEHGVPDLRGTLDSPGRIARTGHGDEQAKH
jgi:hypothetical protein